MPDNQEILNEISKLHQRMTERNIIDEEFREEVRSKLDPMYKIFTSVGGFGDISVFILKGFILIGAGLGVLYAFFKWLKTGQTL